MSLKLPKGSNPPLLYARHAHRLLCPHPAHQFQGRKVARVPYNIVNLLYSARCLAVLVPALLMRPTDPAATGDPWPSWVFL